MMRIQGNLSLSQVVHRSRFNLLRRLLLALLKHYCDFLSMHLVKMISFLKNAHIFLLNIVVIVL